MENFIKTFKENKIEKPEFLYHGSTNKDITEFKPLPGNFENKEGDYVFASPNRIAALAYLYTGTP